MIDHECRTCNKNDAHRPRWGRGPWDGEPKRVEWRHAGLTCIAHRGGMGAWCGYVGVSPEHPAHGKGINDVNVAVHGGLTYAEDSRGHIRCTPTFEAPPAYGKTQLSPIRQLESIKEPPDLWWLGFDCSHAGDLAPSMLGLLACELNNHYWTLEEVRAETEQLAEQLAALTPRR